MILCIVLWSSGRPFVLGSESPVFESWLCHVDTDTLEKALDMLFLTPLMC